MIGGDEKNMAQLNDLVVTGSSRFLNKINGTCTDGSAGTTKYMRQDGTWQVPPNSGGTVTSITLKATSPIAIDSTSAITTSGTRTLSHANSGVTAGTYQSVTVNATGHVTAGAALTKAQVTTALGYTPPTTDTNTTYTLSADTTNNKIKLTPSSGSAQSITVPYSTSAGSATNATQDSDGNAINTTYAKLSGAKFTGAINTANATYNNIGDDVAIGDINAAGTLGVKGLNGATGIQLVPYSGSTAQKISINGSGTMTITGTVASTFSGNLTGNVTGNVSGSSGSCTGNAATASVATQVVATAENPNSTSLYYVPFVVDTGNQSILGNDGIRFSTRQGTTSTIGSGYLVLGNDKASGTAGNKAGSIRLYGQGNKYADITYGDTVADNTTHYLPDTAAGSL